MYIYIYLFAGGEAGRSAADEIQGDAAVPNIIITIAVVIITNNKNKNKTKIKKK